MSGIDLIGDIHGHADALEALLKELGYRERQGVYRHPAGRRVIFVGDFIDRGPHQERVLRLARGMCDAGHARAVMGNHEYNAVCFMTPDPERPGAHLRPHSDKNLKQHREFLGQMDSWLKQWSQAHRDWVQWFRTLPLWLEEEGLRAIHACWHPGHQRTLAPYLDEGNRLTGEGFVATSRKDTPEYEALETLLKGLEVRLPEGHCFEDKDDHERREVRVRWWEDRPLTYREGAILEDEIRKRLPDLPLPEAARLGYPGDKPVFVGHYWMQGDPAPMAPQVACLDYSIAKEGKLCAYRWDGEPELSGDNFVWVAE
ncbi:metallophosphoesterase [Arhodomonas sp. SL1]|uniref:metallophosphoesterase n=1 Tax=Arhodomonas sp. SL1 TaxID=3425691 RepID=UPI003F883633